MRLLSIIGIAAYLAAGPLVGVTAEETLSVKELVSLGTQNNLDLQKAERALREAEDALVWESELAKTSVSVSGSYDSSASSTQAQTPSAQIQLTVPIIPQVSVGASASTRGTAGASLAVTPFAAGAATYKETQAYRTALLESDYQKTKLGFDIEAASYSVVTARASLASAEATLELRGEQLDVAQKTYDLGESTYDDLDTARTKLIAARQSLYDAQRGLLNARVALYKLLGSASGEPSVAEITIEELEASIAERDTRLQSAGAGQAASLAVRQAEIELEALRAQLAATPVYTPSLKISASVDYQSQAKAGSSPLSAAASVSFSFSPSDLQSEVRADIGQSIADAEREAAFELLSAQFQAQILAQGLSVSKASLESRRAELRLAQVSRDEAEVLAAQGRATSLELAQAKISLQSAKNSLFSAAVSVVKAQADLLLLNSR